jgi:hypothetical protein
MGWLENAWEGIKGAAKGTGKALDPTLDLSIGERAENIGRGALAAGTFGQSELVRAGAKELKGITDVKPASYTGVERAQQGLKENQGMLSDMMTAAGQRQAPQMAAPTDINRADVRNITAPTLGPAPQAGMTSIDPEAVGLLRGAAMGQAPSAAQGVLAQGMSQAGQLGLALAGARGGYSPAAVRGAQRQMSAAAQDAAAQASQLRAQEMAAARGQFADVATQQAQLTQNAKLFNATQEGQFALAQADADLKAQLANQGVDLDILKTNAARGDAAAVANLQAQLQTMGMNDAMQLAYMSQILGIDEQILAAEMSRVGIEQQRYILDQQARMGLLKSVVGAAGDVGAGILTAGAAPATKAAASAAGGAVQSVPTSQMPAPMAAMPAQANSFDWTQIMQPQLQQGVSPSPYVGGQ